MFPQRLCWVGFAPQSKLLEGSDQMGKGARMHKYLFVGVTTLAIGLTACSTKTTDDLVAAPLGSGSQNSATHSTAPGGPGTGTGTGTGTAPAPTAAPMVATESDFAISLAPATVPAGPATFTSENK